MSQCLKQETNYSKDKEQQNHAVPNVPNVSTRQLLFT